MPTIDLALQVTLEVLKLINRAIEDQPPEYRRKAWEQWFQFWEGVSTLFIEEPKPKPPTS